jgi:RNA polymerase-binding protein DksA
VAEAPKGRRGGAATKAPPKAAPTAVVDKVETSSFPAKTLDRLRRLLEEERETYVRQARDLAAEAEALASEREPGDTQFDEESGEGDTLNVERERDLALSASANQAVEEIDRALRRMDTGSYGICERCGKKIAVARLEALPFAALCIECKSREERRR